MNPPVALVLREQWGRTTQRQWHRAGAWFPFQKSALLGVTVPAMLPLLPLTRQQTADPRGRKCKKAWG